MDSSEAADEVISSDGRQQHDDAEDKHSTDRQPADEGDPIIHESGSASLHLCQASSTLRRLAALATGLGCQIAVSRKTTRPWSHGATTFASRIGGEGPILRKASFFMRDIGTALSRNFALLVYIHAGEATQCGT